MQDGSDKLDGEHRVQMGLAQALLEAIRTGRDKAERDALLDHFCTYTQVHFAAEQLLMRQFAYPEYQSHALEHDELMDRLDALKTTYESGDDAATLRAVGQIQAWLIGHIAAADERLSRFLPPAAPPAD